MASSLGPSFNGETFRFDQPIILATNRHLASIVPVRLAYAAAGYAAGTVLGRNSVSGKYEAYNNSASSGLDTAVGILFEKMDATEFADSSDSKLSKMIVGGEVFESKLVGMDSNAKTDLGARSIISASGSTILKF